MNNGHVFMSSRAGTFIEYINSKNLLFAHLIGKNCQQKEFNRLKINSNNKVISKIRNG